jgi:hypothetical protein
VWNDLLPGIMSVGFSVCVFLYAWIADIHRIQRLNTLEPPQIDSLSEAEDAGVEPVFMARDAG